MGCGCKANSVNDKSMSSPTEIEEEVSSPLMFLQYTIRFVGFLFFLILLPLVNVVLVIMLFKHLVLGTEIEIAPMIVAIGKKLKKWGVEEPDDDDDMDNSLVELEIDDLVKVN